MMEDLTLFDESLQSDKVLKLALFTNSKFLLWTTMENL